VIDDRTAAYVIEAHPAFEDLRHVAAQLAGLLVLVATGSRDASPDHPMLKTAKQVCAKGVDGVKIARSLVGDRTEAHHRNLLAACESLSRALESAEKWPVDVDAVLGPLRAAYDRLQAASKALPGFEMVSFEQACCGHALGITRHDDHRGARKAH
jgi:hypothetical protein